MEHEEKKELRITNHARIARIFNKICQSKFQVFIRTHDGASVIVKGWAETLDYVRPAVDEKQYFFVVKGLSAKGLAHLAGRTQVLVEFVMVSSKVVCQCTVMQLYNGIIVCALPKVLTSFERRTDARFKTTPEHQAFVGLSVWTTNEKDMLAPPYFPYHKDLATLLPLLDVSLGGVCLVTRFPSLSGIVSNEVVDGMARLYLPMMEPIPIALNVRWTKKRIEHVKGPEQETYMVTSYLVGCMFQEASEERGQELTRFMQRLIESEAI